ncbi:MAG: CBS domain-containing protein [Candidatus Latescibacteria bacterium]|nr:CBS domain-containing protein [Candidatus Latescibacterota bacterium]
MNCPACGTENIVGSPVCMDCGQTLPQEGLEEADLFSVPLADLNPRQPVCIGRQTPLDQVLDLLKGRNIGCLLVTGDEGALIGIFTEADVLYRVAGLIQELERVPVESLMTPRPTSLRLDMPISQALHLMGLHGFRHIPLVDDQEHPIGFVSFRDIVQFIEEKFIDA